MDWLQFIIFAGITFACCYWKSTGSKSYLRYLDLELQRTRSLIRDIEDEMRNFHNRLCRIEEQRDKKEKS